MFCKQAYHPGRQHHGRFRHHHQHHPFKHFMRQMKEYADTPPANVEELDDQYILSIYAPGFEKEDFEIRIKDETLVVAGKINQEMTEDAFRWRRKEFGARSFERYFQLNEKIDKNSISAKYEDGVLKITLPKLEGFESHTQSINIE